MHKASKLPLNLAFFESPNSLTWSPDPRKIAEDGGRTNLPSGLTEGLVFEQSNRPKIRF